MLCAPWQAWALLEQEQGHLDKARQLFEAGSRADAHHLHIWQVRQAGMGRHPGTLWKPVPAVHRNPQYID